MSSKLQLDVCCLSCCGGAIWWTLTKERQAWYCLQVKLCDPCLSALCVPWCKKALYKYSSFPSFPYREGSGRGIGGVVMFTDLRITWLTGWVSEWQSSRSARKYLWETTLKLHSSQPAIEREYKHSLTFRVRRCVVIATQSVRRLQIRPIVHDWRAPLPFPPSDIPSVQ